MFQLKFPENGSLANSTDSTNEMLHKMWKLQSCQLAANDLSDKNK